MGLPFFFFYSRAMDWPEQVPVQLFSQVERQVMEQPRAHPPVQLLPQEEQVVPQDAVQPDPHPESQLPRQPPEQPDPHPPEHFPVQPPEQPEQPALQPLEQPEQTAPQPPLQVPPQPVEHP